jgi:septal ring factor EnvC (AmiA/AmiB activator)
LRERFSTRLGELRNKLSPWFAQNKNLILISFLILLLAVAAGKGITGYMIASDVASSALENLQACKDELSAVTEGRSQLKTSLKACKDELNVTQTQAKDLEDELHTYKNTLTMCKADLEITKDNLESANAEVTKLQEALKEKESDYDSLAENYANYYCCMRNLIEHTNYQTYAVTDNDVICGFGTKELSC